MTLLADTVTVQDVRTGYGGIIFFGCFVLAAMIAFVLWLRRG
jgi:hypothetical protein